MCCYLRTEFTPVSATSTSLLHNRLCHQPSEKGQKRAHFLPPIAPVAVVEQHAAEYMYIAGIQWIMSQKRGHFAEHSPAQPEDRPPTSLPPSDKAPHP